LLKAFLIFALLIYFTPSHAQTCASTTKMITAARLHSPLDSTGLPDANAWQSATSTTFCTDWQGHNPDPQRQTEVRLLWSPEALFIRFHANYRDLYVYPGGPQRRDHLWDRDVAETFLQPPHQSGHIYSEIEVAPNGDWIDLAIANGNHADLHCTMKPRVAINREHKTWTADLALPMKCLAPHFDPKQNWRANFFRIEGPEPNRFYSSWQPTNTPQPNFHVPDVFATLNFAQ
jgi:alpha-galactosidase